MLVVWAMLFLSIAVAGVIETTNSSTEQHVRRAQEFYALQWAENGIVVGLHPDVQPGDTVLRPERATDMGFQVRVTRETGRFNVNMATSPFMGDALQRLFELWGLQVDEARIAVESLQDWIDLDDDPRPNGAENEFYTRHGFPQFPPNNALTSLDQLLLVRGFDKVDLMQPDWRNYLTVYGDGSIDLNSAPGVILEAVSGVSPGDVARFLSERNGPDRRFGTDDDSPFATLDAAFEALGVRPGDAEDLLIWAVVESPLLRIESTGFAGNMEKTIVVLAEIDENGNPTLRARFER